MTAYDGQLGSPSLSRGGSGCEVLPPFQGEGRGGDGFKGTLIMRGQTRSFARSIASDLRKNSTDAERRLWHRLRGEQLGVRFRRQHPYGDYVLDFVCVDRGLVVEVDGSQHCERAVKDEARTKRLEAAGFRILRFWNNQVLEETDAVVDAIWLALNPSPPRPSP